MSQYQVHDVELSEPMLQCLLSEYLEDLAKSSRQKSMEFGERLKDDLATYRAALSAITEAVVYSTIACTAEDIADFSREVEAIRPLVDQDIQAMRQKIFMEGMRSGVDSVGMELATKLKLSDRVELFNQHAGHA